MCSSDLIYPENTYKWLHHFKGKNKIICTFHQPVEYFEKDNYWAKVLKNIDGIILMTSKDVNYFKTLCLHDKVKFIPHGIDTEFYTNNDSMTRHDSLLMVGNWLRDFSFAKDVFTDLLQRNSSLHLTVVANASYESIFNGMPNVTFMSGISDEKLKQLYSECNTVFLPLKSYTANNAILEASSMGCQILIATNNADTTYFNTDLIQILPLDINLVLNSLLNAPITRCPELSSYVKDNYSWHKIAFATKCFLFN